MDSDYSASPLIHTSLAFVLFVYYSTLLIYANDRTYDFLLNVTFGMTENSLNRLLSR